MRVALYRKYRSKKLSEVVGQNHITDVLSLSMEKGNTSHAYLFTGPRGVGKTSIARILAHEINKLPYIEEEAHPDIIEIDAASNNSVDNIRALREQVQVAPFSAKFRVYIIDEVHMLSKQAFNALLKTLEEPPAHAVFILATTDAHKLPVTIISRTQQFVFRLISQEDIVKHLEFIAKKEDIKISREALEIIAERGDGSFRDSITLLDQISNLGEDGEISSQKIEQVLGLTSKAQINKLIENYETQNVGEILSQIEEIKKSGADLRVFVEQLINGIKKMLAQKPHLVKLLNPLHLAKSSKFLDLELLSIFIEPSDYILPPPVISPQPKNEQSVEAKEKKQPIKEIKKEKVKSEKQILKEEPKGVSKKTEEVSSQTETGDRNEFKWQDFLRKVKELSPTIGGILAQSGHEILNDTIKIYAGFRIKKTQLDKAQNRTAMNDALAEIGAGEWLIETFATQKPPKDPTTAAVLEIMGGGEEVKVDE